MTDERDPTPNVEIVEDEDEVQLPDTDPVED